MHWLTDKRFCSKNGYTVAELLLVILTVSIFLQAGIMYGIDVYKRHMLAQTVKQVSAVLRRAKEDALLLHQDKTVTCTLSALIFEEEHYTFPTFVHLRTPVVIYYTSHGQTRHAMTLYFYSGNYAMPIVVWLGGGYHEIQKMRRLSDT